MEKIKAIMSAILNRTGTTTMDGTPCEWAWTECEEEEYGREWDRDVESYVRNLDMEDDAEILNGGYNGSIHNLPDGAIIIGINGEPRQIYWAEEIEEEEE